MESFSIRPHEFTPGMGRHNLRPVGASQRIDGPAKYRPEINYSPSSFTLKVSGLYPVGYEDTVATLLRENTCYRIAEHFSTKELRELLARLMNSAAKAMHDHELPALAQKLSSIVATAEIKANPTRYKKLLRFKDRTPKAKSGHQTDGFLDKFIRENEGK